MATRSNARSSFRSRSIYARHVPLTKALCAVIGRPFRRRQGRNDRCFATRACHNRCTVFADFAQWDISASHALFRAWAAAGDGSASDRQSKFTHVSSRAERSSRRVVSIKLSSLNFLLGTTRKSSLSSSSSSSKICRDRRAPPTKRPPWLRL